MFNRQNQFVTKTCLTTYTYSTTYVKDGTTKIESRENVITNTATEERNAYRIRPTATSGITLTQVKFSETFEPFKQKTNSLLADSLCRLRNWERVYFSPHTRISIR